MNIVTHFVNPPIPDRRFDWSAVDADTYDGADDAGPCRVSGSGPTERAAVADLLEQMEDGEDWQREDAQTYRRDNSQFGVGA